VKKHSTLTLIFTVVFIDLLGFGILIPILPTFATKELHVDETAIGIALAVYSLVQFFFNSYLGDLSDRRGRKPIIVICLFLNAIGYIIFALTNTYFILIVSRVVGGIGGSSIGVAQAYIADITTKEDRSKGMGMIGAAFGLGFVFGPIIGGILSRFGYEVTGFASAGFSLLAFLVTIFFLPESNINRDKSTSRKRKLFDTDAVKKVFRRKDLGLLVILFFIFTFSMANIYGTFALLGYEVYHFSDMQNGYMLGIVGIVTAIVQGGLIRIATKYIKETKLVAIGSLLMMIGLGLLPYGGNITGLIIVVVVLALGLGFLQPTLLSLISEVTKDAEQGVTLGLNQSFSALARVLGPLWGGFAFEYFGYAFPFLTGAFFTFFVVILAIFYLPKIIKADTGEEL
jgi:multidrug resistance protein